MASPKSLRQKYRRWSKSGAFVDQWIALYEEMARVLTVHQVPVSRMVIENRMDDPAQYDPKTYQRRVDDVCSGDYVDWPPVVVEGLPPPSEGTVLVRDGNHRVKAMKNHGHGDERIDAVFARHVSTRKT